MIPRSCRCFAARQPSPVLARQAARPAPGEATGCHLRWPQLIQQRNAPSTTTPPTLHTWCTPPRATLTRRNRLTTVVWEVRGSSSFNAPRAQNTAPCPSVLPLGLGQAPNTDKNTDPVTENKTMQVREGAARHLPQAEPPLLTFRCCCTAPNFSPLLPKGLSIFCNHVVIFKSN